MKLVVWVRFLKTAYNISDDLLLLNTFSAEYCVHPHVAHLAVVEGVGVVSVSGVLLVAVEAVIVGLVQQPRGRGGQTLDSVRVLGVLVVSLVLLGLGAGVSVCCFNYIW